MRTIWKFPLKLLHDAQPIIIPKDPNHALPFVIKVGEQHGCLMMWVEIDDSAEGHNFFYQVVGTGWERPANGLHVGSEEKLMEKTKAWGWTEKDGKHYCPKCSKKTQPIEEP